MTKYGAIFDNDGTIMSTMDEWVAAMFRMCEMVGGEYTQEDIDYLTSSNVTEACAYLAARPTTSPDLTAKVLADYTHKHMLEYYATRSALKPGAKEYIHMLHNQGIPVYIVSSSPYDCLVKGMEHTGLMPCLSGIISSEAEGMSKRQPTLYLRAAEAMGTLPENTWVFEDAIYAVRSAKSGGFRTVGIEDDRIVGTYEQFAEEADLAIRSFTDLALEFPPKLLK